MRPLKLELEGFTCYRRRTAVDFSELDLFAITGPTGAGKTSLVDALAYALYGRIPRASNEVKDFISQEADTLKVVLEFGVGDERYRVLRATSRKATPAVVQLERWVADGSAQLAEAGALGTVGGRWVPEEGRVRQANERIHRLVGLDYDAFTRSVLLPQGQFHQFLAGEPRERRKILSELLRLDLYEGVRERAAALQREAQRDADQTAQLLRTQYADATPENLAERRRELEALTGRRAAAEADLRAAAEALATARAAQAAEERLKEAEERYRATVQRLNETRQAAQTAAEALAREGPELESLDEAISRSPYSDELYAALTGALVLARELANLQERLRERESALDQRESALAVAQGKAGKAEAGLQEAEAALTRAEETWRAAQREHSAASLLLGLRPGDPCPVCLRPMEEVPAAGHPALEEAELVLEGARRAQRAAAEGVNASQRSLALAQQALESTRGELDRTSADLHSRRPALEREARRCNFQGIPGVDELEEARAAQEQARSRLQSLLEQRQRLEARLRQLETEHQRAEAAALELARQCEEMEHALRWAEGELAGCRSKLEALPPALVPRTTALQELVDLLNGRHEEAQGILRELDRRLGSLQEVVERLERDIEEAARLRGEESKRRREALLAGELASLLRADHFQAYMAHQALRVLAEDGSRHLLELSSQRFSLTAAEDDFQVIDHWHADRQRPVRTLSGGETFLASLALALALAERLPELAAGPREGASLSALESLFIDEGFGTLSTDALDCVITGLDNLQRGQRMVGIITHLQELADRLPAQIRVHKTPQGSTIEQS